MENQVLRALGKTSFKKTLKFHLGLNFFNFQKKMKQKGFRLIAKTFSLLELTLLDFFVNIISELVFSTILHLFLLHILLEGEY